MDIRIQSIHFDASEQLQAFIQKKVSKLKMRKMKRKKRKLNQRKKLYL